MFFADRRQIRPGAAVRDIPPPACEPGRQRDEREPVQGVPAAEGAGQEGGGECGRERGRARVRRVRTLLDVCDVSSVMFPTVGGYIFSCVGPLHLHHHHTMNSPKSVYYSFAVGWWWIR